MANIPEFQRRRLASSVVGTPGADRSGQIVGNAVANAAGQVENTAFKIASDRQESKDAALANRTLIDFDMKAAQVFQKHQDDYAEFRGDKMDRVKALQTQNDDLFQSTAESIPSRGARDLFERHGYGVVKSYLDKEMTNADLNQAVLAHSDTVASVNLLAQRAGSVGSADADVTQKRTALSGLLKQGETTYAAAQGVLSAEQRAQLKTAIPESISKGFLLSSMERNPEQVMEMLKDGTFDSLISADDKAKYMNDARAALPKVQERRRMDTLLSGITTHQGMWNKYVSKDPSLLSDLEQSNDPFAAALKDLVIKGDPDPVMSAGEVIKLQAKFDSITNGKKGEKQEIKKSVQLETLQDFMTDVIKARQVGAITSDAANSYLKKLADPIYQKIKIEHQQGVAPQSPMDLLAASQPAYQLYKTGTDVIDYFFSRNNRTNDVNAKAKVLTDYLQRFDGTRIKNASESAALARKSLTAQLMAENPGMGLVAGTPNKILHADTAQTVVQHGDSDIKNKVKIPAKNQNQVFQDGDERLKGDVWYVREGGKWRPKNNS